MGVDFYVYDEHGYSVNPGLEDKTYEEWTKQRVPEKFYVREAYHGCAHAVSVFCPESYDENRDSPYVVLNWEDLLERMPEVAKACIQRHIDYMRLESKNGVDLPKIDALSYGLEQFKVFTDILEFVRSESAEGRKVYAYNSY